MVLLLNVLRDDFVRDVARTDAEVPPRPHVPAPELLPQMLELVHQLERVLPFHIWTSRLIVTCGGIETNRCT